MQALQRLQEFYFEIWVKYENFFGKACDKGYSDGCKNYRILNEQGH